MVKPNLLQKYNEVSPLYLRLKDRLTSDLQELINEASIPILNIQGRVKDFNSFSAKCERKSYTDPFDENEDFLGLRIVVYFPDDVTKIVAMIDEEFDVKESDNKLDGLNADQFGYRSIHKIVAIKEEWASSPGYRGLNKLKCEIQVRTVLMHTWAEIEHKLQYKSTAAVPKELRRKFSLLSAQLETADNQFQELQKDILLYRSSLPKTIKANKTTAEKIELNIETLQRFLLTKYPKRRKCKIDDYQSLIDELLENEISTIKLLDDMLDRSEKAFKKYESIARPNRNNLTMGFADVGVVRISKRLYHKDKLYSVGASLDELFSLVDRK